MKRIMTVALLFVIAIVVAVGAIVVYSATSQKTLHFRDDTMPRALFPIKKGMVELFDTTLFRVDTGSNISIVTPSTLEKLQEMGMAVEKKYIPYILKDRYNRFRYYPTHYTVTLPLAEYKLAVDSASNSIRWLPTGKIANSIEGVNVVVDDDAAINTIGMNVLKNFILEYQYYRNALALRTRIDDNYQQLGDLSSPCNWNNLFGLGNRYYVKVSLNNHHSKPFLIDTGMNRLSIKIPIADTIYSKNPLVDDIYLAQHGVATAVKRDDNAWVKLGSRAGTRSLYYAPDDGEKYIINPLLFFYQDVVIDFADRKIYLRPYAKLKATDVMTDSLIAAPAENYFDASMY
ncbi:MAG: hypothetical protein J1E63_00015 [Muribaculaceae bacterium]|nr:hypothetical protein [Muribaculaceae bacterium]